jgi:hypothetical protein
MKTIISFSLLLLGSIAANPQDKYFIRGDFGLSHAIINSDAEEITAKYNPHNRIYPNYDGIFGLYVGRTIYKNLNIEFGINYQMFSDRYTVVEDGIMTTAGCYGSSVEFIIFPLNAYFYFNLPNSRFSIGPHLGLSFTTTLHDEKYTSNVTLADMHLSNNFGICNADTNTTFTARPANNYCLLLNAGIGFEYKILKRFIITINTNYSVGFDEIHRFVFLWKRENDNNINGTLSYKGTHYYIVCGIKIPI